ncbi:MAG: hypothetical protein ACLFUY_02280 [Desulfobacterales bacterium]
MMAQDSNLKTDFAFSDFLAWTLLTLIPVLTAVYAISRVSITWTVIYLIVLAVCFAGIVYRFFCTHCPHYKNSGRTTKCIFLWGVPAYFEPRPGPLGFFDKFMVFLGFLIAVAFPVYWLLASPLLLLIYAISWIVIAAFLYKYECIRCIHKNCPMNRAPQQPES